MQTRRQFFQASVVAGFPAIVPASVFGQSAPSNHIRVAQIGCGRIARGSEFPGVFRHSDKARFVAVCDLDTVRLEDGRQLVETTYSRKHGATGFEPVKTYRDYREILQDKSIDAVCISTPDHWHAQPAMEAALAGKAVYLQKPASLTIHEGRQMADVVKQTGCVFQQGSQQRSDRAFRTACELVRNGRLGKLLEIFIGLPEDPGGDVEAEMPVPANLNYEMWLGCTPNVFYTEKRVHPQSANLRARYDRPGWLRCEQFGAGMITGWGSHHIDICHWAMGLEHSGPTDVLATAEFPKKGLWDVHGPYTIRATYPNGVAMFISEKYPNGIRFIGEEGWIWVTRGNILKCSNPALLTAGIPDSGIHLHASPQNDHHLDWLTSIKSRQPTVAPAEDGHRSCSACLVMHAAMRLGKPLKWDPAQERFTGNSEANAMLSRPQRAPYGTDRVAKKS